MKKVFLSSFLAVMLLVSGCGANNSTDGIKLSSETPDTVETPAESQSENPVDIPAAPGIGQRLENLVKDAYPGIEIDAFIRERKAILPGFAIPVTVIVKNTGDETVDYIHGSGSYKTPEALFINADGLQAVLPEDHLGPVTMDFRTNELKPGETLEFVLYLMSIEPNAKFDAYTIEMYGGGKYIAESNWDELQKEHPDIIPAKSGSYRAGAYFVYYTRNGSGISDFTTEPNGYAEYDFQISVS